jgi:hypothetical protein
VSAGRVLGAVHRSALRGGVRVARLSGRGLLGALMLLGLFRVTATVAFLLWAVPVVGARSAGWLVVLWWVHRLTRHQRAALYRHELVRKAERAAERQVAALADAARGRLRRRQHPGHGAVQASKTDDKPPTKQAAPGGSATPLQFEPTVPRWLGGGRWRRWLGGRRDR